MRLSFILLLLNVATATHNNTNYYSNLFPLSVIHLNDFHARFEETSLSSTRCNGENCIGGFSRVYTAIHKLLKERPNPIVLNAGDNFQGTMWYNLFKWNVTQHFMNMIPFDAYTLGNHEFDDKIDGVIPFINSLNAPVLVSNMDARNEPRMQGLYHKSTVLVRQNKRIGIIGVILSSTNLISNTENLILLDEIESVNKEAKKLVEYEDCFTIIVLSHCGIDVDRKIAMNADPRISLIVGGHTHTFLYSGDDPPGPETPRGPYPVVVENKNGGKVLVVQASLNSKYLGDITIWYDKKGKAVNWEGNPLYLNKSVPQDPYVNREIERWKREVDAQGSRIIGSARVLLDQSTRRTGESNLGSFLTDAMVNYYTDFAEPDAWTYASIAVMNSGGIRTSIMPGNITYDDLVTAQPFENTIDVGELTGKYIKDFLEYSVTPSVIRKFQLHEFLQVSGIRVVFDTSKPLGSRAITVKLRCCKCLVPVYRDLNLTETYRVIVPSFLANGGDGYSIIKNNLRRRRIGDTDLNVYSRYIAKMSPIVQSTDERIVLQDSERIHNNLELNGSMARDGQIDTLFICTMSWLMYYKTIL